MTVEELIDLLNNQDCDAEVTIERLGVESQIKKVKTAYEVTIYPDGRTEDEHTKIILS